MVETVAENIKTIVVLDLETNGLPAAQDNTCAITELCIFAFSTKCLVEDAAYKAIALKPHEEIEGVEPFIKRIPDLPRVLHKLTMMVNPEKELCPISAEKSGLSNEMLAAEAPFDTNTAECLLLFLGRLEAPLCFVAHNGRNFDYPIVKYVLQQISVELPSSLYCVDSYAALRELDEKQDILEQTISTHLKEASDIAATLNELRKHFAEPFSPKYKFPKKGTYVLGNIYSRLFNELPENLHCAEVDVEALTKIILSYGIKFLAYIEERKELFSNVPELGAPRC